MRAERDREIRLLRTQGLATYTTGLRVRCSPSQVYELRHPERHLAYNRPPTRALPQAARGGVSAGWLRTPGAALMTHINHRLMAGALVLQPHGFEGLLASVVELPSDYPSVVKGYDPHAVRF